MSDKWWVSPPCKQKGRRRLPGKGPLSSPRWGPGRPHLRVQLGLLLRLLLGFLQYFRVFLDVLEQLHTLKRRARAAWSQAASRPGPYHARVCRLRPPPPGAPPGLSSRRRCRAAGAGGGADSPRAHLGYKKTTTTQFAGLDTSLPLPLQPPRQKGLEVKGGLEVLQFNLGAENLRNR